MSANVDVNAVPACDWCIFLALRDDSFALHISELIIVWCKQLAARKGFVLTHDRKYVHRVVATMKPFSGRILTNLAFPCLSWHPCHREDRVVVQSSQAPAQKASLKSSGCLSYT